MQLLLGFPFGPHPCPRLGREPKARVATLKVLQSFFKSFSYSGSTLQCFENFLLYVSTFFRILMKCKRRSNVSSSIYITLVALKTSFPTLCNLLYIFLFLSLPPFSLLTILNGLRHSSPHFDATKNKMKIHSKRLVDSLLCG
jgi:hypothetical protein